MPVPSLIFSMVKVIERNRYVVIVPSLMAASPTGVLAGWLAGMAVRDLGGNFATSLMTSCIVGALTGLAAGVLVAFAIVFMFYLAVKTMMSIMIDEAERRLQQLGEQMQEALVEQMLKAWTQKQENHLFRV